MWHFVAVGYHSVLRQNAAFSVDARPSIIRKNKWGVAMRRYVAASLCVAVVIKAGPVFACATCLCGDPTITTMGSEKPFAGRMRAAVEYLSRSEKTGEPGVSEIVTDEERVTYSFSYAPNAEWIVAASLPFATKQVTRFDTSRAQGSGMGDLDLSARWFLGTDESFPARHLWGLQFGLRVPTSTEQRHAGEVIDIDAQPGAGATIPSVGIWSGRYAMPWFFYTSAVYQHAVTGGYQGYRAGDVLLLTGLAQYALKPGLAAQFSLDGRIKRQDRFDGVNDEDSGGVLIMATPGLAWTPVEDLVVNVNVQIPAVENAHGRQEEDSTLRIGATYDF
jgi:hypothetical protein